MTRRSVVALIALWGLISVGAAAEEASDLPTGEARQEAEGWRYTLGVSWSVTPQYSETALTGPGGESILLRRRIHDASRLLSATFSPEENWAIAIQWQHRATQSTEEVYTGSFRERSEVLSEDWGVALGAHRRLAVGHPVQPRVGLTLHWPQRSATAQLLVSYVRDPVVLSGSLRYSTSWAGASSDTAAIGFGVELVANDVIRLGAAVRHETSPHSAVPPVSVLMFRLGYAFGTEMRQELGVDVSMWLRAGEAGLSFGAGWYGQGLWRSGVGGGERPSPTVAPS